MQDNGGPTLTHALLFGSPAIDTGNPATPGSGGNACETSDQRNFARPADGNGDGSARCDIGAYEASLPTGNIRVTTTTDEFNTDGDCSLREAIRAATLNAAVDACPAGSANSADTIILPAGTYTLTLNGSTDTTGDLDLTSPMTLEGAGANLTLIAAGSGFTDRLIHVTNTTAQFNGLTLRGANTATQGAGLYNQGGAVTLAHSAVVSNTTSSTGGGGIYNTGSLLVTASAVLSNTAAGSDLSGGGLYNYGGVLTLVNTTVSGNRATKNAGGIYSGWGGTVTLANATLTNNTADTNDNNNGDGGGVLRVSGTFSVKNTAIAGNVDSTSSGTKHHDCSGTFTSQGYNLIGKNGGCSGFTNGVNGDQVGTDASPLNPQLGPLAANGGQTLTHAPLPGSPAIDTGSPSPLGSGGNACEATDQRRYGRSADGDANGAARCDIGAYEVGAAPVTLIVYAYDPLYRLTAANYSNGLAFNYTYDAVGNRLTQTTITATTVYTYDDANRLVNVGGVNYTWDNNGNLLNDGASTYAYDSANRLKTLTQGANTYTFGYNGLNDRLQQTVNGNITTYVLDLNAGLTQVLADGTNTYLYGTTRIGEQQPGGFVYHLPDALGSVRQLVNANGSVILSQSHEPYGSVLAKTGNGSTIFGWAGEARDASGLVFLRARFYHPGTGRFFVRDSWLGNTQMPGTLHPYLYGLNNPILHTDPSGQCAALCVVVIFGIVAIVVDVFRNKETMRQIP